MVKLYCKEFFRHHKRPRWRPFMEFDLEEQAIAHIACLQNIYYRLRPGEYARVQYGLKRGGRVRPA